MQKEFPVDVRFNLNRIQMRRFADFNQMRVMFDRAIRRSIQEGRGVTNFGEDE